MDTANYDLSLDSGWKFHLGEVKMHEKMDHAACYGLCKAGGALGSLAVFENDNRWQEITVPHDWLTGVEFDTAQFPSGGYKPRETAWYYTKFDLPDNPIENAELVFEGVLGQSVVYVNGVIVMRNFSGYNRFTCEVSDYLLSGEENIIAVYVDARLPEGWWYEGAGIYRSVYIRFREKAHFNWQDCFVCSSETDGRWQVVADLSVSGDAELAIQLRDKDGNVVGASKGKTNVVFDVENPMLWSPENPYLYELECVLERNGACIDKIIHSVGLRTIEWTADNGMRLNGKPYSVKGICCHQDHAGVGAAVPKALTEYRIKKLKELGANAYRCAHHQPSEELLEICDRYGMLVMVENRHFSVSEDVLAQLDTLVKISRNHPCVFLYSLFNEEPWQGEKRGLRIAKKMYDRIKKLDDTRAVTAAMNGGVLTQENASEVMDVVGVNYFLSDYEECHRRIPDKGMIGTENCPMLTTRGVHKTDTEKQVYANYGEYWPDFSESLDETMEFMQKTPYAAGCFVWCGFDYRGEPQPKEWPSVLSHWGVMDYCGFEKDFFYLLAAWYKDELMVHLLPHWNWKKGDNVRVCAYTNGDVAELFVNGKSYGEKKVEKRRAEWQVPFEKGLIRVVAKRGGAEACDEVCTATEPHAIVLEDMSNSSGVHIVNVKATDDCGVIIPDFCAKVSFAAPKGSLLGVGNGDPNSHHIETATEINFFNGRAQAIASGKYDGKLVVHCDGLSDTEINL